MLSSYRLSRFLDNSHPTSIRWDGDALSKSGMGWEPGAGSLPLLHMRAEGRRRVGEGAPGCCVGQAPGHTGAGTRPACRIVQKPGKGTQ